MVKVTPVGTIAITPELIVNAQAVKFEVKGELGFTPVTIAFFVASGKPLLQDVDKPFQVVLEASAMGTLGVLTEVQVPLFTLKL
ncbi:hypothetical protein FLB_23210 [Flavobacterium succinicans]|uniref:Uncharacterized protein n=1 Tax=Flavobacterium succinicans TaxID=29536 RepID=A0A199XQ39_9FLAO|nr:hypothetical protein FLB_23210 [Flavobacterium succinicans]